MSDPTSTYESGQSPHAGDDELEMLVLAVRGFARDRVAPGVVDRDREERFPSDLIREAGSLGFLGGAVPTEYGGAGLSYVQYAAIVEEMARVDQVVALAMTLPSGLAGAGILRYGSEEQRQTLIPALVSGETVAAVGVTEPSSGTSVADMQTTYRRDGDGFVINGAKTWISQIAECSWVLVFARHVDSNDRSGISAFVVPAGTEGLTLAPFKNKLGFRAISTGEVFLDDVRVPATSLIGEEGQGFAVAMTAVETGRLGVAARSLGVAQDCLDRSVEYAREREVDGSAIGRFQLVQSMITDMVVGVEGARAMIRRFAEMRDRGIRARREASLAKMHASDVAMMAATHAVQIHGAYGVHEDYHVGRHFRDAKVLQIVEGQNQLHRGMVAEYALGYREDRRPAGR